MSAERVIDVPLESLPYIDEHSIAIAAPPQDVWQAMLEVLGGTRSRGVGPTLARALGCESTQSSGNPGRIGSTLPGFVITRSVKPAVLALMGAHRFSRYALVFRITETPLEPVLLSAESRAEFPGLTGRAYRLAVIGTRGHVIATNGLLRAIRRRAERAVA